MKRILQSLAILMLASVGHAETISLSDIKPPEPPPIRYSIEQLLGALLPLHQSSVKFLEYGNMAFAESLQHCYCVTSNQCPANPTKAGQDFAEQYSISALGNLNKFKKDCKTLVDDYLGAGLKKSQSKIRYALALSKPAKMSAPLLDKPNLADMMRPLPSVGKILRTLDLTENLAFLANTSPQHDFTFPSWSFTVDALSQTETQNVIKELQDFRSETCSSYLKDEFNVDSIEGEDSCKLLDKTLVTKGYKTPLMQTVPDADFYFEEKFRLFQQSKFKEYVSEMYQNRFALLLPSNPSAENIIDSINLLLKKATKRQLRNVSKEFTITDVIETNWALPYSLARLKQELKLNSSELDLINQHLFTEITAVMEKKQSRKRLQSHLGMALAVGCFVVPQARILKLLSWFNRSFCSLSILMAFDVKHIIDSSLVYMNERDDYLSTIITLMDQSNQNFSVMKKEKDSIIMIGLLNLFFIKGMATSLHTPH